MPWYLATSLSLSLLFSFSVYLRLYEVAKWKRGRKERCITTGGSALCGSVAFIISSRFFYPASPFHTTMGNHEFDIVRSSKRIRIFTNATTTCCGFKVCFL